MTDETPRPAKNRTFECICGVLSGRHNYSAAAILKGFCFWAGNILCHGIDKRFGRLTGTELTLHNVYILDRIRRLIE
jgi:hypothetical protein